EKSSPTAALSTTEKSRTGVEPTYSQHSSSTTAGAKNISPAGNSEHTPKSHPASASTFPHEWGPIDFVVGAGRAISSAFTRGIGCLYSSFVDLGAYILEVPLYTITGSRTTGSGKTASKELSSMAPLNPAQTAQSVDATETEEVHLSGDVPPRGSTLLEAGVRSGTSWSEKLSAAFVEQVKAARERQRQLEQTQAQSGSGALSLAAAIAPVRSWFAGASSPSESFFSGFSLDLRSEKIDFTTKTLDFCVAAGSESVC
ncbi:unnamed protein product, partial [Amoebophrya sp. A120]